MQEFRVGDKVRLKSQDWEDDYDLAVGTVVTITRIDGNIIYAGDAGSVGNVENGLYSDSYVSELVSVYEGIPFEQSVRRHTDRIANLLIEKNKAYGDSALNPIRVFSKADRMEQLYIRLDDKISRVQRGHEYPGDDTIQDIIGYCVLILIARENE